MAQNGEIQGKWVKFITFHEILGLGPQNRFLAEIWDFEKKHEKPMENIRFRCCFQLRAKRNSIFFKKQKFHEKHEIS